MEDSKIIMSFEDLPSHLEGKTFKELFEAVCKGSHDALEKVRRETGDIIFTPEVEKMLTEDELWYLRATQMFNSMISK